jgi:hypothetical protein
VLDVIFGPGGIFGDGGIFGGTVFTPTPTGPEGPPTGPEGPPTGPEGPPTGPEGPPTGPEGPPSNGPNITDLLTGGAVVAGLGAGGRSRGKSMFQPFMTGLSYQPYQLTPLSFQQRDYAQELTGIIQRNSRGMLT